MKKSKKETTSEEKKVLDKIYNLYLDNLHWTYFPPFKIKDNEEIKKPTT